MQTYARRQNIIDKILKQCHIYPDGSSCWIWKGQTSGKPGKGRAGRGHSYPRMKLDGQTVAVHRVVYTHCYGYIPGKKTIDHKCNNRLCLNPDHLEMVTHKQNCKRRDDRANKQ